MKNSTLLATAAIAVGFASPAAAQDADPDFFTGFYVGGSISAETVDDSLADGIVFDTDQDGNYDNRVRTITGANAFSPGLCNGRPIGAPASAACGDDDTGLGYQAKIGYDVRVDGSAVAGLVLEASKPNAVDYSTGFSTTPASYSISREVDYSVALRGRLGVSPGSGRGLIYATGGATYGKMKHGFTTTNTANSFTPVNADKWVFGTQLGAGGELYLTDNLSFNVEYLVTRYEDDDYYVAVGQGTAPATNPFLLRSGGTNIKPADDLKVQSIRAGINFRF